MNDNLIQINSDKISNFINNAFTLNLTGPRQISSKTAKLDSGASKTYIRPEDKRCLRNVVAIPTSYVGLPDKSLVEIKTKGDMDLHPVLLTDANTWYVLDNL